MIVLAVFAVIVLLVFLILWTHIHLIFDYHDRAAVTVRILCFRFDGKKLFDRFVTRGEKKKSPPPDQKGNAEKKKKAADPLGFIEFLGHVARVIALALKEHFAKTTVYLKELRVTVGTADAAETALLCGGAIQAANALCALLQRFSRFRCDSRNLAISPDFCAEKSTYALHLVMSTRIGSVLGVLIRAYIRFFEGKEDNHARNPVKTSH